MFMIKSIIIHVMVLLGYRELPNTLDVLTMRVRDVL